MIFRLFMTGKFDAYVLWPLDERVQNWIVARSTVRDFTLTKNWFLELASLWLETKNSVIFLSPCSSLLPNVMVTFHVSFTSFFKECNIFFFVAATTRVISVGRSENLEGGNQYLKVFWVKRFYFWIDQNLGGGGKCPQPPWFCRPCRVAKVLFLFFFLDTTKHVSSLTEL